MDTSPFYLDMRDSANFQERMTEMYKSLDSQDSLLCALVGAAHIDKCLVTLLEHYLAKGRTRSKHLDDERVGVLQSLYTRAEFAYMLGLIRSSTLEQIQRICKIRNTFAHSHVPLTFDSGEIAPECAKLPLAKPTIIVDDDTAETLEFVESLERDPKNRFVNAVSQIVLLLAALPLQLQRPQTPFIDGEPECGALRD